MRPTNKQIKKYTQSNIYIPFGTGPSEEEFYRKGAKKGAEWARNFDQWYYIEEGDLPETDQSAEGFLKDSKDVLIIDNLGYINVAVFIEDGRENRVYFDNGSDVWEPLEVKCWKYIQMPKKDKPNFKSLEQVKKDEEHYQKIINRYNL